MPTLSNIEIQRLYDEIFQSWDENLKQHGVIMPRLTRKGKYTKNSMVLIYLYKTSI